MSDELSSEKNNQCIATSLTTRPQHWKEWLDFKCIFDKLGKQGIVGLLNIKDQKKRSSKQNVCVFKISQYINYLVLHENIVMQGLNEISAFCIHFCKGLGYTICEVEPRFRHKKTQNVVTKKLNKDASNKNPFEIVSKYPILKELLLCEYIDGNKFSTYINDENIDESMLYSIVKQTLMAIAIAQKHKKFTHYDLHSYNIMIKTCHKDTCFLYILDEDNQFLVPTYGIYPVIIDFGFSYIQDMDDGPLWTSLAHTEVGFMSDRFDWVADPKLFLITVSHEIHKERETRTSQKFRNIVRNIFYPLKIDLEAGWDVNKHKGAADHITELMDKYNNKQSHIFDHYGHYCIDLIQSLIILPLQHQSYTDFKKPFLAFITQWIKIEHEITNPFYCIYILKGVVDAARNVRPDYIMQKDKSDAVKTFRHLVYDKINEVSQFCKPKNINFEILLCSLIIVARHTEGILYDIINSRMKEKQHEYNKLPLDSVEQIYAAIDINIPNDYEFNENTTIIVFDTTKKQTKTFKPPFTSLSTINSMHSLSKGSYIHNLYKNHLIN